ncbi:MAG: XylR family transcriptional regulator, partial [Opitutaceae bacterium]|nr:XylR family transcriptional regulator [Opitutaceae bacterium]
VIRYQREHGPWSVYFKPQGLGAAPPHWLGAWRGDGILARIDDRRMAEAVLRTQVPAVDLRGALADLPIPLVGVNNRGVIRLAVEHLMERGFRRFAFCGTRRGENRNQDERADRFAAAIADSGFSCDVFQPFGTRAKSWEQEQREIVAWLRGLPKPVGLMTCHDDRGQQVLDACLRADLAVPDAVAILGVDNDPFLCSLSTPQLSSIDTNPERVGYEAAALLDRMMKGARPPQRPLFFEPRGLVVRQSTDVSAVSDPHVAHAARLIRTHALAGATIKELAAQVPVSRSALFRRFKEHLGHSPKEELTRVRLERAKELLKHSALPVAVVAARVGYAEAKHFIAIFRRATGCTPLRYRKESATTQPD